MQYIMFSNTINISETIIAHTINSISLDLVSGKCIKVNTIEANNKDIAFLMRLSFDATSKIVNIPNL